MELIEFKDLPNTDTPINAENLNHNFNYLAEKNYIVATITNEQALSSNYVLTLDEIVESYGDKLTLSKGKILIGKGISKIKVSGSIFVNFPTSAGYVWGAIRKGETKMASNITTITNGTSYLSTSIPPNIFSVVEGDTIDLLGDSTCGGSARTGKANTWLCVEVIE